MRLRFTEIYAQLDKIKANKTHIMSVLVQQGLMRTLNTLVAVMEKEVDDLDKKLTYLTDVIQEVANQVNPTKQD